MGAPQTLGRYRLGEKLGQGGMGSVYRAQDPALERTVAVKTLGGAYGIPAEQRAEFLERFQREARAAGRLSHPNIVAVHDLGVDAASGTPFIVMEYVPGVSLATVLKENPVLPIAQALEIVEQVAAALDEAHRHGVVHRDVKPANVFLDERGRVKVGDFGIARLEDSELTQAGVGLGTPGYIAPEVLRGQRADARSDLFALGVLAYALLAGRKAFAGDTRETLAVQVLESRPPAPRAVRPEVPAAVSDAVMRALAKRPEERQAGVAQFLRELRGETPGPAAGATRTVAMTRPPKPPAPPSRQRLLALLLLLALLGGIAGLLAWRREAPMAQAPLQATPRPTLRPTPRPVSAPATTAPAKDDGFTIQIQLPKDLPKQLPKITLPGQGKDGQKNRGKGRDKKKDRDEE
jgi:serine/threonine-protein kinase